MAIAIVQKATVLTNTASPTFTLSSAPTAGNLLVVLIQYAYSSYWSDLPSPSANSNWTIGVNTTSPNQGSGCLIAYHLVKSGDGTSQSPISYNQNTGQAGVLYEISGAGVTPSLSFTSGSGTGYYSISLSETSQAAGSIGLAVGGQYGGNNGGSASNFNTDYSGADYGFPYVMATSSGTYSSGSSIATVVSFPYSNAGAYGIVAALIAIAPGATSQTYTYTPSDGISISDSISKTASHFASRIESLSISDSASDTAAHQRFASDSAAIADSITKILNFICSQMDATTLSDSLTQSSSHHKSAADSLPIIDTILRAYLVIRTPTDSVAESDSVSRLGSYHQSPTDSLPLTNSVLKTLSAIRTPTDTFLPIAERLIKTLRISKADSILINDSVGVGNSIVKVASDSLISSDFETITAAYLKSLEDSLPSKDTIHLIRPIHLSDSMQIVDEVTFLFLLTSLALSLASIKDTISLNGTLADSYQFQTFIPSVLSMEGINNPVYLNGTITEELNLKGLT